MKSRFYTHLNKFATGLALVLTLSSSAFAQSALVQCAAVTAPADGASQTNTVSLSVAATAGRLVTVLVVHEDSVRTLSSITDNGTTSYAAMGSTVSGNAGRVEIWRGIAAGAGAGQGIDLNWSGSPSTVNVTVCESSGNDADQSGATNNGAAGEAVAIHSSGSVTPPTASNIIFVAVRQTGGDYTYDIAFTQIATASFYWFGYIEQAAATAQSFDFTSVDNEFTVAKIAAFAGTSSGGGTVGAKLLTLGVGQ